MNQDDWTRVNDLFHRALSQPSEGRSTFLRDACAGNTTLLTEVASLLAAHEQASTFIETPAVDAAAALEKLGGSGESLVGTTVGHYAVLRMLGAGGMGVVYLAEDTKLGRVVALKALAPQYTGDAGRRERLRREARAAAALSHPGIATVYALEEVQEHLYIACEYVPGETLREEVHRGAQPVATVLATAIGLARALTAAHDRGLVHRDLKPENVIRSRSGHVKILDFGLARFSESSAQPLWQLTDTGMVLGTPAYMSPEQIRGQAVDFRTDLFSLGILLYELASGIHPFAGGDSASTIARILEAEPRPLVAVASIGGSASPSLVDLDAIVTKCLEKAPTARFTSTQALVDALELAQQGLASPATRSGAAARRPSPPPAPPQWWWQFHQAAASAAYLAMLWPMWYVREWTPGLPGSILFIAALVGALIASTLRLHLWFTVRAYPAEWTEQRQRAGPWIRLADFAFVATLVIAAMIMLTAHAKLAIGLVAVAVAILLSSTIIEPATARAAFGKQGGR